MSGRTRKSVEIITNKEKNALCWSIIEEEAEREAEKTNEKTPEMAKPDTSFDNSIHVQQAIIHE
ncbi:hypothetical protein MKX03_024699, partial [Papaver bracteatum]